MFIGLTGPSGSGKDAAADYLKQKGFSYFSCSDIIREECAKRGIETTRENLINVGNELRENFGNGYLAEEILKKIKNGDLKNALVVSIRHPDEVKKLKENPDFAMLLLDASLETRYGRIKNRKQGRPEDKDSFEKFKKNEEKERTGSGSGQQLDLTAKMADYIIINDGNFSALYKNIDEMLKKYVN